MRNWVFVSSLFDLFLKYSNNETPTAAIKIASKIIGQYLVPNDIKSSKFKSRKYTHLLFYNRETLMVKIIVQQLDCILCEFKIIYLKEWIMLVNITFRFRRTAK